eukprot:4282676-Karenia_brevis.AAC.1
MPFKLRAAAPEFVCSLHYGDELPVGDMNICEEILAHVPDNYSHACNSIGQHFCTHVIGFRPGRDDFRTQGLSEESRDIGHSVFGPKSDVLQNAARCEQFGQRRLGDFQFFLDHFVGVFGWQIVVISVDIVN